MAIHYVPRPLPGLSPPEHPREVAELLDDAGLRIKVDDWRRELDQLVDAVRLSHDGLGAARARGRHPDPWAICPDPACRTAATWGDGR